MTATALRIKSTPMAPYINLMQGMTREQKIFAKRTPSHTLPNIRNVIGRYKHTTAVAKPYLPGCQSART